MNIIVNPAKRLESIFEALGIEDPVV